MAKTELEENTRVTSRDRKADEMYDLIKENNEMLHTILKRERIGTFFKVLYWAFIIATALGLYYKFDTILEYLMKYVLSIVDPNHNFVNINGELPQIKNLMDTLNGFKLK